MMTANLRLTFRIVLIGAALAIAAGVAIMATTAEADKPEYPAGSDSILGDLAANNPSVAAALSDGAIDGGEVRAALSQARTCLEDNGIRVQELSFSDDGNMSLRYASGRTEAEADVADELAEECMSRFAEPMLEAFAVANRPSNQETAAYVAAVIDCLQDRGFNVSTPEEADKVSDRTAKKACSDAAEASIFDR